ncbi:MAG: CHAT domain-containing protein [Calditrichaeota bacterium]|nr:MAG: CHAT domain-containing protein [Calditrichota bacterium]
MKKKKYAASKTHLIHNRSYHLDPLLRQMLHTALCILRPSETFDIHQKLMEIYEEQLHKEAIASRPTADALLEILYHVLQQELISHRSPLKEVKKQLERCLQNYFSPSEEDDVIQLQELSTLLPKDEDLRRALSMPEIEVLQDAISVFIKSHKMHGLCILSVHFNEPNEYQASWTSADPPILPMQIVHTEIKYTIKQWREDIKRHGLNCFKTYFSEDLQRIISESLNNPLMIATNTMDIPFELLHDGNDFLCLSRCVGRQIAMVRGARELEKIQDPQIKALVVGDPTDDLKYARKEARAIAKFLKKHGAAVDLLVGSKEATLEAFADHLLNNQYHLIHFSGHGYFDHNDPALSGLLFKGESKLRTFKVEEFRYIQAPSFFFLNACEAASAEKETTREFTQGRLIQNLAIGTLEAGACGCLAPMWKVPDKPAKDFAIHFYELLLQGEMVGEALRQSRLYIKNASPSDLWASWILFSNPCNQPLRATGPVRT